MKMQPYYKLFMQEIIKHERDIHKVKIYNHILTAGDENC